MPELRLRPTDIRFIQNSIKDEFQNGRKIDDVINAIRRNKSIINQIPLIRVVSMRNHYYSLDNRRLYIFRVLECEGVIDTIKVKEVRNRIRRNATNTKFTTENDGISIYVRQGNTRKHTRDEQPIIQNRNQSGSRSALQQFPLPKTNIFTASSHINPSYEPEESEESVTSSRLMTPSTEILARESLSRSNSKTSPYFINIQPTHYDKPSISPSPSMRSSRVMTSSNEVMLAKKILPGAISETEFYNTNIQPTNGDAIPISPSPSMTSSKIMTPFPEITLVRETIPKVISKTSLYSTNMQTTNGSVPPIRPIPAKTVKEVSASWHEVTTIIDELFIRVPHGRTTKQPLLTQHKNHPVSLALPEPEIYSISSFACSRNEPGELDNDEANVSMTSSRSNATFSSLNNPTYKSEELDDDEANVGMTSSNMVTSLSMIGPKVTDSGDSIHTTNTPPDHESTVPNTPSEAAISRSNTPVQESAFDDITRAASRRESSASKGLPSKSTSHPDKPKSRTRRMIRSIIKCLTCRCRTK